MKLNKYTTARLIKIMIGSDRYCFIEDDLNVEQGTRNLEL